jgi:glutathione S-transferase
MARVITLGIVDGDLSKARERAKRAALLLDDRLRGRDWLATENPTIADIACYPYLWNVEEGGVNTAGLQEFRAWLRRIEHLPGFIAMASLTT